MTSSWIALIAHTTYDVKSQVRVNSEDLVDENVYKCSMHALFRDIIMPLISLIFLNFLSHEVVALPIRLWFDPKIQGSFFFVNA